MLFCVVHTFLFSSVLRGDQGVVYLSHSIIFFFFLRFYLTVLGLHGCGLSLVLVSKGYSLVVVHRLLISVASLVAEHGL